VRGIYATCAVRFAPNAVSFPHKWACRMALIPCANLGGDHCDFCQSSPVFTVYPCTNFLHNGLSVFPGRAGGTWATCQKCAQFVDQKRWACPEG
jgi:hypothetical protein